MPSGGSLFCASWRICNSIHDMSWSIHCCIVLLGPTFWPLQLLLSFQQILALAVMQQQSYIGDKGHDLWVTCRKSMEICFCARGYSLQKTHLFEGWRPPWVRGDAPTIALKPGRLMQLFCLQKFYKNEKRKQSTTQISKKDCFVVRNCLSTFPTWFIA